MYIKIEEISERLKISEKLIIEKIIRGRLNLISDGEHLLVDKEQFDLLLEKMKNKTEELKEEYQDVPEDYDVKDED